MSRQVSIVAVTSLALEASIARGPGVSVLCSQALELSVALSAAIAHGASGIISFGIAGGLAPDLIAGDWVVASGVRNGTDVIATDRAWTQRLLERLPDALHAEVVGVDILIPSPLEKFRLYKETGAAAVDMESDIAAKIAAERRIPFAACRVIIDAACRTLPPAATVGLRPNGTPDLLTIFRSVWQDPSQLPDLMRTAFDARIARRALRLGRGQLGEGLGFPYFNGNDPERTAVGLKYVTEVFSAK
jgi:hopanoid-associated phosphorylase